MTKILLSIVATLFVLVGCTVQNDHVTRKVINISEPSNVIEKYDGTIDLIGDNEINRLGWNKLTSNKFGFSVLYPSFNGVPAERFIFGIDSKSGNYVFNDSPVIEIDAISTERDDTTYESSRELAGRGPTTFEEDIDVVDIEIDGHKGYIVHYVDGIRSIATIFTDTYIYRIVFNTNQEWTGNYDESYLGIAGKQLATQEGIESIFFIVN